MVVSVRVLIVDDHELFAEALGGVVRKLEPGSVVVTAASAEAGLEALTGPAFDLVLLDLGLPGVRGPAAFDAVIAKAGSAPIVVVSGSEPTLDVAALLKKGARGFLHKRSSSAELALALRYVLDGGTHVPAALLDMPRLPDDLALTPRQTEVLSLIAKGATNKDIADALGCAEATVRVHVSTVLRLLNVENRTQAATSPIAQRLLEE